MPPPEPRSRTRSPGWRSATAVGLPQPSDARTAASGQLVALEGGVQVRADGLGIAATRGALRGADRGVGVVLPDGLVDGLGGHRWMLLGAVGS